ncbi:MULTISPECIES: TMEM165/GDT1 family protein [unclassified Neisseria]|uniref:TMEM165/GDT1 family protein n=1 Tax=unclassified Neisseria TaxID=2623750 RepID=UPI001071629C|nr:MULTISPECIES: TMEM165/GDT1 family protein [unclassified Neisseria]MBF0803640.1 TMEM165/GDT1 family protein [Neisseria sp. 19428wB4_WF04]TFU43635.1 TMEM165/GDT1 family protein [Neisseria sp. WF04]
MEAFFSSALGVAIAEIGDKTQLLALFLAARFARKNAIAAGIFTATLLNHAVSAVFGVWLAQTVPPEVMKWIVGLSFIAVGLWLLLPDPPGGPDNRWLKYGAFGATAALFFLAEIGDKTQIATVLLAARYQEMFGVVAGSTLGLMLASLPAVYLGETLMKKIPPKAVRLSACALFCILGAATLAGGGISLQ